MRRLNDAIVDEKISAQIDHLEDVTGKIIDQVVSQPKKLSQIRRFMDYYLPTTLKILNAYDRMDSTGIAGDNISTTKAKVERMMDTITQAFDKQLDALFGEEALDISTDITVMENLLAQEGLGGMTMGAHPRRTVPSWSCEEENMSADTKQSRMNRALIWTFLWVLWLGGGLQNRMLVPGAPTSGSI